MYQSLMYLIVSSTLFICLLFSILSKCLFDFIGSYHPLKHNRRVHHRCQPRNVHVSIHRVALIVVCAFNVPIRGDYKEYVGVVRVNKKRRRKAKDKVKV